MMQWLQFRKYMDKNYESRKTIRSDENIFRDEVIRAVRLVVSRRTTPGR